MSAHSTYAFGLGLNQTIQDDTPTLINLVGVYPGYPSGWFDAANPTILTVPSNCNGLYHVQANVVFENAPGAVYEAQIVVNGTTFAQATVGEGSSQVQPAINMGATMNLGDGWNISLRVYQKSGGPLNIVAQDYSPTIRPVRLGNS
jgi:hypothetical protein